MSTTALKRSGNNGGMADVTASRASGPELVQQARRSWSLLTGVSDAFRDGETRFIVSGNIPIAPSGWTGIVALGDACLVMAPTTRTVAVVRARAAALSPEDVPRQGWAKPANMLGPAELFFGETPRMVDPRVEMVAPRDPRVRRLLARVSADDAREPGLADVRSAVFAIANDGDLVAGSGYALWPGGLAHLCVLTDPAWRRLGYARRVAAAAISNATEAGLMSQWRASTGASQLLAQSLGLSRVGAQVSVHLNVS